MFGCFGAIDPFILRKIKRERAVSVPNEGTWNFLMNKMKKDTLILLLI